MTRKKIATLTAPMLAPLLAGLTAFSPASWAAPTRSHESTGASRSSSIHTRNGRISSNTRPTSGRKSARAHSKNGTSSTSVTALTGPVVPASRLPTVVATVNGVNISRSILDAELENTYDSQGSLAQRVLANIIIRDLVRQRAARLGLLPTPQDFETQLNRVITQTMGRLPQLLQMRHLTLQQFEQQYLAPQIEIQKISSHGVTVTPFEIENYFNRNKQQWLQPEMVQLYRIRTTTLDAAKAAKADLDKGVSWAEVVKKYDTDPPFYKDHEGYYGPVIRTALPKPVQDAIANAKAGEITQPVELTGEGPDGGWTLWRVAKIVPAREPTLAEHREEIRNLLLQQKAKPEIDVLRDVVRSAKITNLPKGWEGMFAPLLAPPSQMMPMRPPMGNPNMTPPPPPGGPMGGPPGGPMGGPPGGPGGPPIGPPPGAPTGPAGPGAPQ